MRISSSSNRPRRHPSRTLLLTLSFGLAATLSACGDETKDDAGQDPEVQVADLLLSARDLPEGWGDSNSQGVDYRVTVCGVDLEPSAPAKAVSARFSQGPLGPFLEQHVRVYEDDVAREVVAELQQALPDCTGYEAKGSAPHSPTARFDVEPLTVEGAPADSVAWRQTSRGDLPITSDLLLVPHGNTAVMLMSYALRDNPDPGVLEQAVASLPAAP
ncbi:hypothetical protein [Nocardioides gilvus]|uniref:hypothetical protein n=1 Tax=Nocardioides gilvus TaxID=1735589 RepID=UPI000D7431F0|nr:hypothetical protein [Nocardioides gilvus]